MGHLHSLLMCIWIILLAIAHSEDVVVVQTVLCDSMDMSFEMENACFPNTTPSIDCCIFAVHCLCGLKDERSFFDNGLSLQDMADFYSSSICQGQDLINAQVVVDACEVDDTAYHVNMSALFDEKKRTNTEKYDKVYFIL
uniref:Bifunctional inhibitor/plant lipid transfer protein/seed storage helical domain-containing protein n=1 Tax=Oryza meridionalis TaxID=40149 RepID=A0A0E0D434_9ORYZ